MGSRLNKSLSVLAVAAVVALIGTGYAGAASKFSDEAIANNDAAGVTADAKSTTTIVDSDSIEHYRVCTSLNQSHEYKYSVEVQYDGKTAKLGHGDCVDVAAKGIKVKNSGNDDVGLVYDRFQRYPNADNQ